jgi:hypothetical protein
MHRPPFLPNAERKRAADFPLVQHDPPAPLCRVRDRAISAASSSAVSDAASTNPAASLSAVRDAASMRARRTPLCDDRSVQFFTHCDGMIIAAQARPGPPEAVRLRRRNVQNSGGYACGRIAADQVRQIFALIGHPLNPLARAVPRSDTKWSAASSRRGGLPTSRSRSMSSPTSSACRAVGQRKRTQPAQVTAGRSNPLRGGLA